MIDEREQLRTARELITKREFAAARRVLLGLPGNPTAQKWLAKLDEIDPSATTSSAQPPPGSSATSSTESSKTGPDAPGSIYRKVPPPPPPSGGSAPIPGSQRRRRSTRPAAKRQTPAILGGGARYLVSAGMMLIAVIMFVGFFAFDWMDLGMSDVTAFQIWIGHDGNQPFTLDLASMALGRSGFGHVRPVDRLLILVPIGAVALGVLAWMYATEALKPRVAVVAMTVLAALLLAFPYAWQEWSKDALSEDLEEALFDEFEINMDGSTQWEQDLMNQFFAEVMRQAFVEGFEETYSTEEQRILGWVAVGVCIFALVSEFAFATQYDPDEFI